MCVYTSIFFDEYQLVFGKPYEIIDVTDIVPVRVIDPLKHISGARDLLHDVYLNNSTAAPLNIYNCIQMHYCFSGTLLPA